MSSMRENIAVGSKVPDAYNFLVPPHPPLASCNRDRKVQTPSMSRFHRLSAALALMLLWHATAAPAGTLTYTHDTVGRVVSLTYSGTNVSYNYDSAGNLLTRSSTSSANTDLAVTQATTPDSPTLGTPFALTLTVANLSAVSATSVQLTDTLPASFVYVSAVASQGSSSFTAGTITGTLGTLAPGASATVTLQLRATVSGPITHTASVTSAITDSNSANNTTTQTLTILGPPALAVSTFTAAGPNSTVQLLWPALAEGFILEETTSLTAPVIWTPSLPPSLTGGTQQAALTPGPLKFYRLRGQ